MSKDRMVDPKLKKKEERQEKSLRPKNFEEVIGREKEKRVLNIMIEAAKKRNEAVDHILFHGPPGLGKTSLAFVIANELGNPIFITSGPAIERQGDLASILTNIEDGGILFIDEIHRLNKVVEEVLYPAMEDRALDIIIGKGPSAKTLRLDLPDFTLIGATTKVSLLSAPLRDRFGADFRLDFYSNEEMKDIVNQKANMLGMGILDDASKEVADRSRSTARIAVRLLRRVRDLADVEGVDMVDVDTAKKALDIMEIDEVGLDFLDRKILESIIEKFGGGPVGLSTLAASILEEYDTVESVYEPYLMKEGFIERTPRGRVATKRAYEHLGLEQSDNQSSFQQKLIK
ncbi:MAG TPA: Holliday junction branch migration DNA helicase RuvB [bacterium]|nr:Holliday junction branch migration DNA helicase RuvB [bacterium]